MALCIKRYLVNEGEAASVVEAHRRLELRLKKRVEALQIGKNGVTAGNFADHYQGMLNWFSEEEDDIFLGFVTGMGLAPALDARDESPLSFDNFFKWSIRCVVAGDRLLVEVKAIAEKFLPFEPPPCFRELNDGEFYIFSGGRKDG